MVAAGLLLLGAAALAARTFSRDDPARLRQAATEAALAGRWAEAAALLDRIPTPQDGDRILRAQVDQELGRPDAALAELDRLQQDSPLALQADLLRGQIELKRHRARAAEKALLRALDRDPKLASARRLLVYLYGSQARRPGLLRQFAALAEQGPLTSDLVFHWCLSRAVIGEPEKVRPDLERFVAADPDDRESRLALADTLRQLGEFSQALATLEPLPDTDADARAARAQVALDAGDLTRARTLLSAGPEGHPLLERLRGRLALSRRDGAEALRHFRAADAAEPNQRDTLSGLAQALRIAGDEAAAAPVVARTRAHDALRNLLRRFADAPPSGIDPFLQLASACTAAGYPDEARAWYRLVIATDPLNARAQEALFKLGKESAAAP